MALYLLGIFMGAIDTGIVTPARTIIQNDFGVDDKLGIWMITIYTLAYAASIPVMGKLADRLGRKQVYLLAIALFGVGSLACGLSESFGGFWMLIGARAVQAIGGGGIIPIATAEIGTEVPPEKRGLALGLVGGVYGIANIFGASAGSLILDIVGAHNWQWIFYVNVPIAIVIVIVGIIVLPNHKASEVKPLDIGGTVLLVAMILSLLYGLRNIDFFAFGSSLTATTVWPYLLGFVLALPVFILVDRQAAVEHDGQLRAVGFQSRYAAVVERRNFAILFRAQPLENRIAGVHREYAAAGFADGADKIADKAVTFALVDADAVLDRHRKRDHIYHGLDAIGHKGWLGHQACAKSTTLHALGRAAAIEIDLVIPPLFAQLRAMRQVGRLTAAELQCDWMLLGIEHQVTSNIAMDQGAGGHHFGVEQGLARQKAVQIAAMAIRPIHHRRH